MKVMALEFILELSLKFNKALIELHQIIRYESVRNIYGDIVC